jgi:hypothetical protein
MTEETPESSFKAHTGTELPVLGLGCRSDDTDSHLRLKN